ncbi:MAG: transposase, partial [Pseudomonadota bacterium]
NEEIGVTRGRVEAIFGHWKRNWGLRRTRFMGRAQADTLIALAAIGWNLQKGVRFKNIYG